MSVPLSVPMLPEGTRDVLPPEWAWRERLRGQLGHYFAANGYQGVDVPTLERQNPHHPQDSRAFKLTDRDGSVLSLRSEFTTAISELVRRRYPQGPFPLRLQYAGRLWLRTQLSELGRLREFTQLGVELLGVRGPRADAELLRVALGALQTVGVEAQLEIGHPGFVDGLLEDHQITGAARDALHRAVDRKSGPDLSAALREYSLDHTLGKLLHAVMDLYGGPEILAQAAQLPLGRHARAALGELQATAQHFGGALLFDLGMSRRYDYYTGFTFRAYVAGHAQPVLGGGRYGGKDGALEGAGFAIGLERLSQVVRQPLNGPETLLALDEAGAAHIQAQGLAAERIWTKDVAALQAYAQARQITRLARGTHFFDLTQLAEQLAELTQGAQHD